MKCIFSPVARTFICITCIAIFAPAPSALAGDPPAMRLIPAGEFTMGTDDPESMPNERPSHRVKLDGFWIDEHDVTNAEFRKFVEATGYLTTAEKSIDWEQMIKEL